MRILTMSFRRYPSVGLSEATVEAISTGIWGELGRRRVCEGVWCGVEGGR